MNKWNCRSSGKEYLLYEQQEENTVFVESSFFALEKQENMEVAKMKIAGMSKRNCRTFGKERSIWERKQKGKPN